MPEGYACSYQPSAISLAFDAAAAAPELPDRSTAFTFHLTLMVDG